ncbi:MAG: M28 family peptidase [Bacteroidota bacterium]
MKKYIYFLFAPILLGCAATGLKPIDVKNIPPIARDTTEVAKTQGWKYTENRDSLPPEPVKKVNSGTASKTITFSDATRTKGILNFLASDKLKGRDTASEGIEKAAQFIEGIFEQNQVLPYFKTYRDTLSNFAKTATNVVGWVPGSDPGLKDQYILIGAHYDHIGIIKPQGGDAIANGANDNATGTTTVLELARYFGNERTNGRSLIFVLFTAEEKGLLGSKHLAKRLKANNLDLYLVLNYEMLGVSLNSKKYLTYASGYKKSNIGEVCNAYAGRELVGFLPTAERFSLFQRSDNYPFHQEFNVPSHTFCTFDFTNFDHYHKVSDETDQIDFEHMARIINSFIPVVSGLANASEREVTYY